MGILKTMKGLTAMIHFEMLTQTRYDSLGYIPRFLVSDDPRPARVQFNQSYLGGWHKIVKPPRNAGTSTFGQALERARALLK